MHYIFSAIILFLCYLLSEAFYVKNFNTGKSTDVITENTWKDKSIYGGAKKKSKEWYAENTWKNVSKKQYNDACEQFEKNIHALDWKDAYDELYPDFSKKDEVIGMMACKNKKIIILTKYEGQATRQMDNTLSIPAHVTDNITLQPGLIIYHTHPDNTLFTPTPQDICVLIDKYIFDNIKYIAVVSKYGIFLITLTQWLIKYIKDSTDLYKMIEIAKLHVAAYMVSSDFISVNMSINDYIRHMEHINIKCYFYPFKIIDLDEKVIQPNGDMDISRYKFVQERYSQALTTDGRVTTLKKFERVIYDI
jgi:hypothetical protein